MSSTDFLETCISFSQLLFDVLGRNPTNSGLEVAREPYVYPAGTVSENFLNVAQFRKQT